MLSDVANLDVDAYLRRIGFDQPIAIDIDTLAALQRAHLTTVPFENLDVHAGIQVETSLAWSVPKIIERHRGGWCFELNGAFGALLEALGFAVRRLGAAVLLDGPATVIDHLALEVQLEEPWLVDVGFGDSFVSPLALNKRGPQSDVAGIFEFLPSPQGTTLTRLDEGVPVAQYRFKRVAHDLAEFEPASDQLQSDPTNHWRTKPFATRLVDGGPDRVTLLRDRLKVVRPDQIDERLVARAEWASTLGEWFGMIAPDSTSTQPDHQPDHR